MSEVHLAVGAGRRLNVLGDNVLIRLSGKETRGLFTMGEQSNPAGVGIPLHVHDREDELFQIVEGSVTFTVGDKTFEAKAGETVYLPRGIPHGFVTSGEGITRSIVTAFPSGIEHMFEELAALPAGPPDMGQVFEICGRYGIRFLEPTSSRKDNVAAA